ncbi:MAG: NAD(P)/FAD-dependent oxidoreductase [Polyangiaceae bacterium]|nr:NAD(P)/FAD-dependent oxidoreductase [Polyangiaceae bacterium]
MHDVIVIGGGPAGLSAALVLGRCRRRVLLCDSGRYRNAATRSMHGFLTRDGIHPAEMRQIAREQLKPYPVEILDMAVTDARKDGDGFEVTLVSGERRRCRKLLLATGLIDELPELLGLNDFYGTSVFHCPYCDAWEVRDKPLGVLSQGAEGVKLATTVRMWSSDVVLFTNGPADLEKADTETLERLGISLCQERIERLEGAGGVLERVLLEGGRSVPRRALFLKTKQRQHADLAKKLRVPVSQENGIEKGGKYEETYVKGVFVAGDASKDLLMAIVAASEGAQAAFGINCELQREEQCVDACKEPL